MIYLIGLMTNGWVTGYWFSRAYYGFGKDKWAPYFFIPGFIGLLLSLYCLKEIWSF